MCLFLWHVNNDHIWLMDEMKRDACEYIWQMVDEGSEKRSRNSAQRKKNWRLGYVMKIE